MASPLTAEECVNRLEVRQLELMRNALGRAKVLRPDLFQEVFNLLPEDDRIEYQANEQAIKVVRSHIQEESNLPKRTVQLSPSFAATFQRAWETLHDNPKQRSLAPLTEIHKSNLIKFLSKHGTCAREFILEETGIPEGSLSALLKSPEFCSPKRGFWALKDAWLPGSRKSIDQYKGMVLKWLSGRVAPKQAISDALTIPPESLDWVLREDEFEEIPGGLWRLRAKPEPTIK